MSALKSQHKLTHSCLGCHNQGRKGWYVVIVAVVPTQATFTHRQSEKGEQGTTQRKLDKSTLRYRGVAGASGKVKAAEPIASQDCHASSTRC